MTISAVNRYPLDSTRSARERRIEKCANSKMAVIESFTDIAVAYTGMKALIGGNWRVDRGPAMIRNATARNSTTPRASRFCARLGDKLEKMKSCSAGPATEVCVIFGDSVASNGRLSVK